MEELMTKLGNLLMRLNNVEEVSFIPADGIMKRFEGYSGDRVYVRFADDGENEHPAELYCFSMSRERWERIR